MQATTELIAASDSMLSVGLSCLLSSTVASDYLLEPPGWYSRLSSQKTPLHLKSNVPSPNCTRVAGWRCFQGVYHGDRTQDYDL